MLLSVVAMLVALYKGATCVEIYPAYQKIFVAENAASVALPCKYRKAPMTPLSIQWTLQGQPVLTVNQFRISVPGEEFVGRVSLGEGADLILRAPSIGDTATYTCTITMSSGSNPTASGDVALEVTDCEYPDITAAAVCMSFDVIALILLTAWFGLRGRPGVIQVTLVRRILICVAVGSLLACVVSVTVLIVYVTTDCVQDVRRLRVAGILFCVLTMLTAILVWLLSSRRQKRQAESVSAMYEDDSDTYKAKQPISHITTLNEKAMLDTGDGGHRTTNGGGLAGRESPHIPDDMVKIIGNNDNAPGQRLRRFEELRTREHVEMAPNRFPPESPGLSDVFFDDEAPLFGRAPANRGPSSVSSSASGSQVPRQAARGGVTPPGTATNAAVTSPKAFQYSPNQSRHQAQSVPTQNRPQEQPKIQTHPAPTHPQRQPAATQPATTQPMSQTQAATTQPRSQTQAATTQPRSQTQPATTQPRSQTQPATTQPRSQTQPATTQPRSQTQAATTQPRSQTQPAVTQPRSQTQPATTQPKPQTQPRPQTQPGLQTQSTTASSPPQNPPDKKALALNQLNVPDPDMFAAQLPLRDNSSMRKARSEEVLKRGASLVTIPPERRSLPLSVEEKLDQDIFLETCRQTLDYFVETAAYKRVEERLFHEDTRGITITGAPGDGKTATAMYAAWKLHSTAGFLPLKVRTVAEIERIYIDGLKLVFVLDDPFGKLCRSSDLQDYWMSWSKRLQECLSTTNVKIIATVRSDIWESCRYSVMRFWPFSSHLSISTNLSREEKQAILTKHLSLAGVDIKDAKWRETIHYIIHNDSKFGFPQNCQLLRTSESFRQKASSLFQNPTALLRKDMKNLLKNDPGSFCILALMVIHGCKLSRALFSRPLKELPSSEREKIESVWKACAKRGVMPPTADEFVKKVDHLCKTYIVKAETCVEFSLTTLAEVALLEIGDIDLSLVFKWCHADVIIGKLVPQSCRLARPLLSQLNIFVPPSYCPQLASLLTEQLLTGNIRYVLENPGWESDDFVRYWEEEVLTTSLIGRIRGVHGVCCQGEALHRAAARGLLSVLKVLLRPLGKGKDGTKVRNEFGQTLLHSAATGGHESTVRYLLETGCPVDAVNDSGETPLFLAALHGHLLLVEILLEHKANPDLKTKLGLGALHAAVFGDRTEIVSCLLPRVSAITLRGASRSRVGVTSFRDRFLASLKHSGLHEAARCNDLVRIHHFLDNGFEKNDQNKYGWTPLYISVMLGHVEAAALFLTRGADPDIATNRGSSPLDEACCGFNDPLISVLLSYSPKRSSCL